MKAIIAVNNLGYIGKNNTLIWKSSEDLKHFKKLTDGCRLLIGHNTFQTIPELPNRTMVLDGRYNYRFDVDWCVGGKKTYEKYCDMFDELHISYINDNSVGDTMFPDLKRLKPECKIFRYYFEVNK